NAEPASKLPNKLPQNVGARFGELTAKCKVPNVCRSVSHPTLPLCRHFQCVLSARNGYVLRNSGSSNAACLRADRADIFHFMVSDKRSQCNLGSSLCDGLRDEFWFYVGRNLPLINGNPFVDAKLFAHRFEFIETNGSFKVQGIFLGKCS